MARMRITLAITFAAVFGILPLTAVTREFPLKQDVEILKQAPMQPEKVKEGLYIIRGPALPCMVGCKPGETGDGLIHESGDVAVRVTPEGLILVDDRFPDQAAEVLKQVKVVSPLPVKYMLNSHHHSDHAGGNANVRRTLGIDIIGHQNIRENFRRLKQPGEPCITSTDRAAVYLGGVEVRPTGSDEATPTATRSSISPISRPSTPGISSSTPCRSSTIQVAEVRSSSSRPSTRS